ncbi:ethanolaminephosphotransferase [Nematocida displodere]|uniref:Ethanolaminephosphotransferase n=1 Tax=Nematocida displodere TaxID=1805483 RepID=A0A177EIA8_9MICR|nr:ethanolaminephosphotransferase [Nematocida displodere]
MLFPPRKLENLKHYVYSSQDDSFLVAMGIGHYHRFVLGFFPTWVAPNLITLTGFLAMLVPVACILLKDPNFRGNQRVALLSGLVIWFYSTMDCIDGMQARRTGSGSVLGQLFDHGVDSLVSTLVVLCLSSGVAIGDRRIVAMGMIMVHSVFYWATMNEFYTGVLYLGVVGPTELLLGCSLLLVGCYFLGHWAKLTLKQGRVPNMALLSLFVAWTGVLLYNIVVTSRTCAGLAKERFSSFLLGAVVSNGAFVMFQASIMYTLYWSSDLGGNVLFYGYILLCTVTFSLFSILTIYSHQLGDTHPEVPVVLPVLVFLVSVLLARPSSKRSSFVVVSLVLTGVLNYIYHINTIITEICATMGISCFRIE